MSVSSAPATPSRVGGRSLGRGLVSGAVVAAAVAGLLIGGRVGGGGDATAPRPAPPAPPPTIAHDGLRLQVPSGWERAAVGTVPGFRRPLSLRNTDAALRATVELLPVTSATLVPAALISTLSSVPAHPEVIRLASSRQAWRYRLSQNDGSVTFLYAAPTTSGVATVACAGATAPRGCDALARAVTVPGSRAFEPGTSAAFYSRLPATVSELDAARGRGTRELSAATRATGQATAAAGLARAHKAAGAALGPLTSEGDSLPTATVGALNATATAYAALASAARGRSPKPYADAGRAVSGAEADLRGELAKVAAAASVASRTRTTGASTPAPKPAARSKPAAAEPPATTRPAASTPAPKPAARSKPAAAEPPATARPAASTPQGTDLTVVILLLASAAAIFFAVRAAVRTVR
jgi:hypothetical protein